MTGSQATKTVLSIKTKNSFSDRQISKMLTISRMTYYKRRDNNSWKETEIALIEKLRDLWL